MFCQKCGTELHEEDLFCWNCGARIPAQETASPEAQTEAPEMIFDQAETQDQGTANAFANAETREETGEARFQKEASGNAGQQQTAANPAKHHDSLFNRFWNHPLFTKAAIQFNRFVDWIYAVITLPVSVLFFQNGNIFYGILLLLFFAASVYNIVRRFQKKRKARASANMNCPQCGRYVGAARFCPECGTAMPQPEVEDLDEGSFDFKNTSTLRNKKSGLLLTPVVIVIVIFLWSYLGGNGPAYEIKNASFNQYGTQTVEEVIEKHFKDPKWSVEKITDDFSLVYVQGYMVDFSQQVNLTFSYEEYGDGTFSCELAEIKLLGDGEVYNDIVSINTFLSILYE